MCLQDPHFKASNHRRRIIQPTLLTEYAHIMASGGWLYTITDVPELGEWMVSRGWCWRGSRVRDLGLGPPASMNPKPTLATAWCVVRT